MTRYLSPEQLVLINALVVGEGHSVRDMGLVEAAAARPLQTGMGVEVFPTTLLKAAALLHSLASTQPFMDGNKRTAWTACRTLLEINGIDIGEVQPIEGEVFVLAVALNAVTVHRAAEWLTLRAAPLHVAEEDAPTAAVPVSKPLRAAAVMNRAGLKVPGMARPLADDDIWVTCPLCELDQSLWQCSLVAAEHVADVSEYICSAGCEVLAVTGHHSLHLQPLQWSRYRLGDYAIEARADLRLRVADDWVVLPSSPD